MRNGEERGGGEADGQRKRRAQRERSRVLVKQNKPENNMQHPCLERRAGAIIHKWRTDKQILWSRYAVISTGLSKLQRKADHNFTAPRVS